MHIWSRSKGILVVGFLVPREDMDKEKLIIFHLSLPLGYIESDPFFCVATVKYHENKSIGERVNTPPYPLEGISLSVTATGTDKGVKIHLA